MENNWWARKTARIQSYANINDVLYTEGCIILSLTAGGLNVSYSNGKMPTFFLVKIMLTRLLEHVVDLVLPESQCGFQRGCNTIDIFVAQQLQKNIVNNIKTYTWPSLI